MAARVPQVLGVLIAPLVFLAALGGSGAVSWSSPYPGGTALHYATVAASNGSGTNVLLVAPSFSLSSSLGTGEALSFAGPTAGGNYGYDPLVLGVRLPAWTCPASCPSTLLANSTLTVSWNATEETKCVGGGTATVFASLKMRAYVEVTDVTAGTTTAQNYDFLLAAIATCNLTNTFHGPAGGSHIAPALQVAGVATHVYLVSVFVSFESSSVLTCPTKGCGAGSGIWTDGYVRSLHLGSVFFT